MQIKRKLIEDEKQQRIHGKTRKPTQYFFVRKWNSFATLQLSLLDELDQFWTYFVQNLAVVLKITSNSIYDKYTMDTSDTALWSLTTTD